MNNVNATVRLFVKNVTDPVGEFWEKKALEQTGGVGAHRYDKALITVYTSISVFPDFMRDNISLCRFSVTFCF